MKRTIVALALSGAVCGGARADDSLHDWSGLYAGFNAGVIKSEFQQDLGLAGARAGSLENRARSAAIGLQAGYNRQLGRIVYGIEADIQAAPTEMQSLGWLASHAALFMAGFAKRNWTASARARVGFALSDRALAYATGGLATGRIKTQFAVDDVIGPAPGNYRMGTESRAAVGWTAGMGAEFAYDNTISFKTEYLHADLGRHTLFSGTLGGRPATVSQRLTIHSLRAGVNFHF